MTNNLNKTISEIKKFLNEELPKHLTEQLQNTTGVRFSAELLEEIIIDLMFSYQENNKSISNTTKSKTRRSMADFSFDLHDKKIKVDIKTHRLNNTVHSMPNITSIKRLTDFYKNNNNYFLILTVKYLIIDKKIKIENISLYPIEKIPLDYIRLGNLGWGQIQIKNHNKPLTLNHMERSEWLYELVKRTEQYYTKEIEKSNKRREHFTIYKKEIEKKENY